MLKGKMIVGAEVIIRRLEVSEVSFMDLVNRKRFPARLNGENRWTISEADLKSFEAAKASDAAVASKKKSDLKN